MDLEKMESEAGELSYMALEAKHAINALKALQKLYMKSIITYDAVQIEGKPLVAIYNKYAKALSKARKMPYKPISLGYFLR